MPEALPSSNPTRFADIAALCAQLESTSSRTKKTTLIAEFLRRLQPSEIPHAVRLILGRIFPENDPRTLEIGWSTISSALHGSAQTSLFESPLTIRALYDYFSNLAETGGKNSRRRRESLLKTLFGQTNDLERDFLLRILSGEMRHGVVEGVMHDAISKAANVDAERVRRADMLLGDISEVALIALTQGEKGLATMRVELFRPVKPMLAEMSYEIEEVLREHGGTSAFEFKLDGARIQIHKRDGQVKIFSRRLSDVTESLPDIVELAKERIKASETLVEGEVVAVSKEGKPLPFQELMRRFRRVHEISILRQEIPLRLFLFDILQNEGEELIDKPYTARWERLSEIIPSSLLTPRLITSEKARIEEFMKESLQAGHEGLMAKALNSSYTPGHRGKKWFKIKPTETLDLVIIAAEWGTGRRKGWLSNYHLAARDPASRGYAMLGKTFKGLTDEEFKLMTQRLQQLKTAENEYMVSVQPEIVVEVAFNEIQRSPHYKSGYALRFARIARIREDKNPEIADTIERVNQLYRKQFEAKGRLDW